MFTYDEQQIHKQLSTASEQQEINHISWLLTKNSPFKFGRGKEEDISEWADNGELVLQLRQRSHYLLNRDRQNRIGYSNCDHVYKLLSPDQATKYKIFRDNSYKGSYESREAGVQPNKLNIKLALPESLAKAPFSLQEVQRRERYLPILKKAQQQSCFMRSAERKAADRSIEKSLRYLKYQQNQLGWNQEEDKNQEKAISPRRGKLIGLTIKHFPSFRCPPLRDHRQDMDSFRLRDCISFLKN